MPFSAADEDAWLVLPALDVQYRLGLPTVPTSSYLTVARGGSPGDANPATDRPYFFLSYRTDSRASGPFDAGNTRHGLRVAHNELGDRLLQVGHLHHAERYYRAAIEVGRQDLRQAPDDMQGLRDLNASYSRLADLLLATGRAAGAINAYRRAVAASQRLLRFAPHDVEAREQTRVNLLKVASIMTAAGDSTRAGELRQRSDLVGGGLAAGQAPLLEELGAPTASFVERLGLLVPGEPSPDPAAGAVFMFAEGGFCPVCDAALLAGPRHQHLLAEAERDGDWSERVLVRDTPGTDSSPPTVTTATASAEWAQTLDQLAEALTPATVLDLARARALRDLPAIQDPNRPFRSGGVDIAGESWWVGIRIEPSDDPGQDIVVGTATPDSLLRPSARGGTRQKHSLLRSADKPAMVLREVLLTAASRDHDLGAAMAAARGARAERPRAPARHHAVRGTGRIRFSDMVAIHGDQIAGDKMVYTETGQPGVPASGGRADPTDPERLLAVDVPDRAPVGAEVSLLVRIIDRGNLPPGSRGAALKPFAVAAEGTDVTVIVETPVGLWAVDGRQRVIRVPPSGDSDPARISLYVAGVGLHQVVVTAWIGGTLLGELTVEISASADGTSVDGLRRTAPLGPLRAEPGEVTLQVRFDDGRYTFQLLSEPYIFEPVIAEALTANPGIAVERAKEALHRLGVGRSGYEGRNAREWMEGVGIALWNDMVPQLIKEQFWQLRENISSFSIAAANDTVPWELLYPLSASEDEGFLVEQFPVLRRVYRQRRTRSLCIGDLRFVLPPRRPSNADDEIHAIRRLLAQIDHGGDVISELEALLRLVNSGTAGALHFSCHNDFRTTGGSSIEMAGGPFVPDLLERAVTRQSLAERHPVVFINACQSASGAAEYRRMMSWANQFMAAGAGAFVGTLWNVVSTSAAAFAVSFYEALLGGLSLGEATRRARIENSRDGSDPTWLAYSVYGDPAATAEPN
ncbi:CHAT domain-containing protein [Phytohabitans flavus]|uniref:CHAT domain-containing protein n=1 Tax=Phytohabitans flavus TaxID=1076124 RepID=UPI0031E7B15C